MKQASLWLLAVAFLFPVAAFGQQPPISKTSTTSSTPKPSAPAVIPSGRVAVIDTTKFPTGLDEYKKQIDKMEQEFKPRTDELNKLKTQIEQIQKELESGIQKPEIARQKAEQGEGMKKELQRKYEDYQADVDKRKEELLGPLSEKVYRFLQDYSSSRGIVAVFDIAGQQTPIVVVWDPASDITTEFMKEYNRVNPVAGTPATPPNSK